MPPPTLLWGIVPTEGFSAWKAAYLAWPGCPYRQKKDVNSYRQKGESNRLYEWRLKVKAPSTYIQRAISGHHQYSSSWSLPQLVIDISGGRAIVRPLHDRRAPVRMVPLRLCRRYGPSVQRGQEGPGSPDVEEEGEEPMGRASHEAVDEPPRSRRRTSERR
eukprot:GHVS01005850.1.p2 GENE.GHVS01005850.1~~GHVS01005850.1.p2  ORF type:complete len:161 (-),score=18.07 GHVS01005850.1:67-549(-)